MTLENKFVTIVGLTHYDGNLQIGDVCTLVVEENNQFDPNAIRVEHDGEKVGYVKRGKSTFKKYVFNKDLKDADIDVGYIRIEINKVNKYMARGVIRFIGEIREKIDYVEAMENMIKLYNKHACMHDEESCKHIARLIKQLEIKMGE